jgi:hypothetical protein
VTNSQTRGARPRQNIDDSQRDWVFSDIFPKVNGSDIEKIARLGPNLFEISSNIASQLLFRNGSGLCEEQFLYLSGGESIGLLFSSGKL